MNAKDVTEENSILIENFAMINLHSLCKHTRNTRKYFEQIIEN